MTEKTSFLNYLRKTFPSNKFNIICVNGWAHLIINENRDISLGLSFSNLLRKDTTPNEGWEGWDNLVLKYLNVI